MAASFSSSLGRLVPTIVGHRVGVDPRRIHGRLGRVADPDRPFIDFDRRLGLVVAWPWRRSSATSRNPVSTPNDRTAAAMQHARLLQVLLSRITHIESPVSFSRAAAGLACRHFGVPGRLERETLAADCTIERAFAQITRSPVS